jgi:hypothetical protein
MRTVADGPADSANREKVMARDNSAINTCRGGVRSVSANPAAGASRARIALVVGLLAAGMLSGGCVRRDEVRYPKEWSAVAATSEGACPKLEGRYVDTGTVAGTCSNFKTSPGHAQFRGSWGCEHSLSSNIADLKTAEWFEIRQPDADTLLVASSDPKVGTKTLHRSHGDFSCGAEGLTRKQHFNIASLGDDSDHTSAGGVVLSTFETASFIVQGGMAGVRTLTRNFNAAEDGSLVMSVSVAEAATVLLLPVYSRDTTYVRWTRVPEPSPIVTMVAGQGNPPQ